MTDRALLQQALEALEEISGGYSQNLIAALRERLAQPEQEPVAYWHKEFLKHNTTSDQPEQEPVIDKSAATRIATSLGWEPKRKPLTDEEIERACVPLGAAMLSFTEVARAIEAAHGIKGKA